MDRSQDHPTDEQLFDLLDGELDAAISATVSAHVDACTHCADLVASAIAGARALAGASIETLPADQAAAIAAAIDTELASRASARSRKGPAGVRRGLGVWWHHTVRPMRGIALAGAATVLVVAIGGAVVLQSGDLNPSTGDDLSASRQAEQNSGRAKRAMPGDEERAVDAAPAIIEGQDAASGAPTAEAPPGLQVPEDGASSTSSATPIGKTDQPVGDDLHAGSILNDAAACQLLMTPTSTGTQHGWGTLWSRLATLRVTCGGRRGRR